MTTQRAAKSPPLVVRVTFFCDACNAPISVPLTLTGGSDPDAIVAECAADRGILCQPCSLALLPPVQVQPDDVGEPPRQLAFPSW